MVVIKMNEKLETEWRFHCITYRKELCESYELAKNRGYKGTPTDYIKTLKKEWMKEMMKEGKEE